MAIQLDIPRATDGLLSLLDGGNLNLLPLASIIADWPKDQTTISKFGHAPLVIIEAIESSRLCCHLVRHLTR